MKKWSPFLIMTLAVLLSLLLHFKIFGYDPIGYHVWRQTQTQTVIDNFINEDQNILNPRLNNLNYPGGIIRMEFPLYQWLIARVSMLTGNSVLTARVFTFITAIFSMLGFYLLANVLFKNKILAAAGAWALFFSPVFYYYMVNPLPDNLALCFGIYALYYFAKYFKEKQTKHLYLYALLLSFAVLTKLPFVLFGIPFVVLVFRKEIGLPKILVFTLILLPAFGWYAAVIGTWEDNGIINGAFNGGYDLLTWLDYFQFNFISTLPELFINYAAVILFVAGLIYVRRNKALAENALVKCFFWGFLGVIAYTLFELNMIAKVHDYYLFPYLPFLFLLILYGFKNMLASQKNYIRILAFICILAMPVTAYLRSNTRWNMEDPGFNPALLEKKKEIQRLIPQNAICLTGNDDSGIINLYYLHRKGYTFFENGLDIKLLEEYKKKRVTFLVSDAVLSEETNAYLGTPLATFNDLKIYKLK